MNGAFKHLGTLLFLIVILNLTAFGQEQHVRQKVENLNKFEDIREVYYDYYRDIPEDQRQGWKQFKRWEWYWSTRLLPDGTFPDYFKVYKELDLFSKANKEGRNASLSIGWQQIGPFEAPYDRGGRDGIGRVNIIRIDPNNQNILWAGAAGGGVWRSTNNGQTWTNFPYTNFNSQGVSDIAIASSNSNIVYVSTGDIFGSMSAHTPNSVGVIKTTNAGNSWEYTNLAYSLSENSLTGRILVDPDDANIVIAATYNGIFKTTNGGDTWLNKQSGRFIDMEFNPVNPNILYASTRGWGNNDIFKSTDKGETWRKVHTAGGSARIAIDATPANPDKVYAVVASVYRNFHSFLRSDDAGETWRTIASSSADPNILGRNDGTDPYGQGEYDLAIAASPYDENLVYVGGINIWATDDGGENWLQISHWYGGYGKPYVHADIHDLEFNETTGTLYSAHDGGIDITFDGGASWREAFDGPDITQFYKISIAQNESDIVIGGSQDNGTSFYSDSEWRKINGGDGMDCLIDPTDENNLYYSTYYGNFYKSTNGGESTRPMINSDESGEDGAWVSPLAMDPSNPQILYAGYVNVFKNTNAGNGSWQKISDFGGNSKLQNLAVSPSNGNYVYASSHNAIYRTSNGGTSWDNLSLPYGPVTSIEVDPQNPANIWVTIGGFSDGTKVFYYDGNDWLNISGNLPNVPTNAIRYQRNSPDRLYVANDIGVFYTDYGSNQWDRFGDGLPNLVVTDLEIHEEDQMMYAGTYGRGVWKAELLDCNLPEPQVQITGSTEFCEGDSVILTVEGDYNSYEWNNGETTKQITVKESGYYSVTIVGDNDCKARSSVVHVEVNQVPDIRISGGDGYPLCEGDDMREVELRASLGFKEYMWSTGETGRSITVSELGQYSVTGIAHNDCEVKSEVFVLEFEQNPPKPDVVRLNSTLLEVRIPGFEESEFNFQWYKDGESIFGARAEQLTIDEPGVYMVEAFNEAGCGTLSDTMEIITSVGEIVYDPETVSISPNPGKGPFDLTISNARAGDIHITVTTTVGEKIFEKTYFSDGGRFDTSLGLESFAAGVYFVTIRNNSDAFSLKLIKE